jgi:predicted aldo/keto reductase-like oxidoreductase
METMRLGRSGLTISRMGFGCLPIQRVTFDEARTLLRKAVDAGVTFFDTARGYSDSEEKMGTALADVRDRIVLATKIPAVGHDEFLEMLDTSLTNLRTDCVDLLQLHNPKEVTEETPAYVAALEAKQAGKARVIGVTNHRLDLAIDLARSGLFDTIQFPLSAISAENDLRLIEVCRAHDIGVIAMKALCGGLLTNIPAAFAFLRQFDNVVPIWGIQHEPELDEFLALEADPPPLDDAMRAAIERERAELAGDFCRGCGYCLPCPADIPIPMAARMKYLLGRSPWRRFVTDDWQQKMERIEDCRDCGECGRRCPYGLHPPDLLRKMLDDYRRFVAEHV